MFQRGLYEASGAGFPVGRGRGRASVLPAWMTNPELAREAQASSGSTVGATTSSSSQLHGVYLAAGSPASSVLNGSQNATRSRFDQAPGGTASSKVSDEANLRHNRTSRSRSGSSAMKTSHSTSPHTNQSRRQSGQASSRMRSSPHCSKDVQVERHHDSRSKHGRSGSDSPGDRSPSSSSVRKEAKRNHLPTARENAHPPAARSRSRSARLRCGRSPTSSEQRNHKQARVSSRRSGSRSRYAGRRESSSHRKVSSSSRRYRSPRPSGHRSHETHSYRNGRREHRSNSSTRVAETSAVELRSATRGRIDRRSGTRRERRDYTQSSSRYSSGSPAANRSSRHQELRTLGNQERSASRDHGTKRKDSSRDPLQSNTNECCDSETPGTCRSLCLQLNELRNIPSYSKRNSLLDSFVRNVDLDEFVFEDAYGHRGSWRSFERKVLLDERTLHRAVQVTRRVFIKKNEDVSYCLEAEWSSDVDDHHNSRSSSPGSASGKGLLALYESRKGKLTRCFLFKDSSDVCSPLKKSITFESLRSIKVWNTVTKYLLKKGLPSSAPCTFYDAVTRSTEDGPLVTSR